jgi:type II secretory pathway pseudopilin PulG
MPGFFILKLSMRVLRSDSNGFTIVELIAGIVILGLFVGSVVTLITNNARLSQRGRSLVSANSYAENKIEALRSAGYLSLTNGTTSLTSELPVELKTPRSASQTIASATPSVKRVDLSITYNEQGINRTYTYTSYIGELGVGQY